MDELPPVMLEQGRLRATLEGARVYGREHPDEFGGLNWINDEPVRVVFWATDHLDDHRRALAAGRVEHPERVVVRQCRYTERQVDAWLDEVHRLLVDRPRTPRVTSWGQHLGEDGIGIQVTIWPWSDEGAEWVRDKLAPIPIEVAAMPPAKFLGPYSAGQP
ncbi:hypothetical protein [Tenggerimyces flavus]|uniref:Uncharacterized protein n=1 Tax=Tenggerimyces flavus TaxID=1708749 RepID=A0ABV7Y4M9_9ACTN|nr:hypothetical protein [Tenggerimyces flavus]MBM7790491.1 hypothetical protein [Tenggerimyces flavus]